MNKNTPQMKFCREAKVEKFYWLTQKNIRICYKFNAWKQCVINESEEKENLIFINKLLLFDWILVAICYLLNKIIEISIVFSLCFGGGIERYASHHISCRAPHNTRDPCIPH